MPLGIANAVGGKPIDVRRLDGTAVAAERGEPHIVQHDVHDARCALGSLRGLERRPVRLRIPDIDVDDTAEWRGHADPLALRSRLAASTASRVAPTVTPQRTASRPRGGGQAGNILAGGRSAGVRAARRPPRIAGPLGHARPAVRRGARTVGWRVLHARDAPWAQRYSGGVGCGRAPRPRHVPQCRYRHCPLAAGTAHPRAPQTGQARASTPVGARDGRHPRAPVAACAWQCPVPPRTSCALGRSRATGSWRWKRPARGQFVSHADARPDCIRPTRRRRRPPRTCRRRRRSDRIDRIVQPTTLAS